MDEEIPVLGRGRFYGVSSSFHIGGVTMSEVYHDRRRELPLHGHEAAYFCMLLEGDYRERSGDTEMAYGPFTIAYHATSMRHTDAIGENGARFFIVELDDRWAEMAQTFASATTPLAEVHGGDAVWSALRLYLDLRGGTLTELAVESSMYELIAGLQAMTPLEDREREAAAVGGAADVIDREFSGPIGLARLAESVGLHPVVLARIFRRTYKRSIGEYIHGRRVQAVSRALLETDDSIAKIAADCGFFDQSHLTRVFKAVTGTTPKQYRKHIAGAQSNVTHG
jgi:AraC family transcriptional regulator